ADNSDGRVGVQEIDECPYGSRAYHRIGVEQVEVVARIRARQTRPKSGVIAGGEPAVPGQRQTLTPLAPTLGRDDRRNVVGRPVGRPALDDGYTALGEGPELGEQGPQTIHC